jgi:DNA repair exonuclease SbcCD ATPase subunit
MAIATALSLSSAAPSPIAPVFTVLPQQLAQQVPVLGLEDASSLAQVSLAESAASGGEAAPVQDVLGLVDAMGDQARKARALQAQLQQARSHEQQLNSMVLVQTKRADTIDQNARQLAQQSEESMSKQQAMVDGLKKQLAATNKQAEEWHVSLLEEEHQNQKLNNELSDARHTLQDWQQKLSTANRRAKDAEERELNALKAGELEDMALKQQETLLDRARNSQAPQYARFLGRPSN